MNQYTFTSTAYWNYTESNYTGLIITNSIPVDSIVRKLVNLKAVRFDFGKTAFRKSEPNHFKYIAEFLRKTRLESVKISRSGQLIELPIEILNHPLKELQIDDCTNLKDCSIVGQMNHLEEFHFGGKELNLPKSFFELSSLKKLVIQAEKFNDIEFLPQLKQLESLHIAGLNIECLPHGIRDLVSLKTLSLSRMSELKEFPRLDKMTQLEEIKVHDLLKTKGLPNDFEYLENLKKLSVYRLGTAYSEIELPPSIFQNEHLIDIVFSQCPIKELPDSFTQNANLISLGFFNLKIQKLPRSIRKLQKLERLYITECEELEKITPIRYLKKLKELDLRGLASLYEIDFEFNELPNLERLSLINLAELSVIPTFGKENSSIQAINFSRLPQIKILPESIQYCTELSDVKILEAGFEAFPESLKNLKHVMKFGIYHCHDLSYVPSSIFPIGITTFTLVDCPRIQENSLVHIHSLIKYVKEKVDEKYHPILAFWLFNNYGKEPLTDEMKVQTLEVLTDCSRELHTFILNDIYKLNPNQVSLKNAKNISESYVSILGATQSKKTLLRKQLEEVGFKYSQKITEKVSYVLIGKKPKMPDDFWGKERILFHEVEFAEWHKNVNPGMLQKEDTPKEFIHNIRRLLWSNTPANELVALEMVMNHGLPDEVEMDFIAVTKTSVDTKVRAKIRKLLKGSLSGGALKLLNDPSKIGQKYPRFYKYEQLVSFPQLGQFALAVYKKTGLNLERFFGYDDGNSPYRKEMFQKILPSLLENPKYLKIQIGLTENEINEVLKQPIFKGNLQRLVIISNNVKSFPTGIFEHETIKDLQLNSAIESHTIPLEFFELTKLTKLNLWWNNLINIPPEIGQLTRLKEVLIYPKEAIKLPEEFKKLTKLKRAYFSNGLLEIEKWQEVLPNCGFR
ncbi:MAG: hypothetical protein NXI23_01375 [Bacteroidetes bacterium]|jgi:hypothetical protein|nr:hypothetical protein [Bacteroidota bacterium]